MIDSNYVGSVKAWLKDSKAYEANLKHGVKCNEIEIKLHQNQVKSLTAMILWENKKQEQTKKELSEYLKKNK